ncbi:MAG: hypothetical protein IT579_20670, partial [Verrucomicrobia subdivision 3 bacterium]|nr:hypothetical protein [Limisphaerales bacterium]
MVESKIPEPGTTFAASQLITYINIKLALLGLPPLAGAEGAKAPDILAAFAAQFQEKDRLLGQYLCPADQRIQTFLYDYLQDVPVPRLPLRTFTLDRPGLARVLSLPLDRDVFASDIVNSYRV